MANRTPHIVGGGLGTFRKEGRAKFEKNEKERKERERREALSRIAKAR